jgi:hypothetical protein
MDSSKQGNYYIKVLVVWLALQGLLIFCSLLYYRYPFLKQSVAEKDMAPYVFLPSLVIAIFIANLILYFRTKDHFSRRDLWITGIFWMIASLTLGVVVQNSIPESSTPFFLVLAFMRSRAWYIWLGAFLFFPPVVGSRYLK